MASIDFGRLRQTYRSRRALLAVGVALVAAVLFALVTALGGGSSASPQVGAAAVGGASDTDQTVPIFPFPVRWVTWETIPLPDGGPVYGPTIHEGGAVADGYADTPRSAVVAAVQISARAVFSVFPDWQAVLDRQVLPGPGRDVLASYHAQKPGRLVLPDVGLPRMVGFKVLSYTPSQTVVAIAQQRVPQEPVQVITETVRWADSTWKLELQPTGSPVSSSYTVDTLPTDFVQFGLPW